MGFGPKVIGQAAYDARVVQKRGTAGFGSRVTNLSARHKATLAAVAGVAAAPSGMPGGSKPTIPSKTKRERELAALRPPPPPAVPEATGISVEQIIESLADNPLLFDPLYEQELARPEGPRGDALRAFRAAVESDTTLDEETKMAQLFEIDELLAASAPTPSEAVVIDAANGTTPPVTPPPPAIMPTDEELEALSFADLKTFAGRIGIDTLPAFKSKRALREAIRLKVVGTPPAE